MKSAIKYTLGRLADRLLPSLKKQVDAGEMNGRHVQLKRCIVHARLVNARRNGDSASISSAHFDYWKNDSSREFYRRYASRFQKWFLPHHSHLIETLRQVIEARPTITRLIEIGCGDGRVAEFCQQQIPQFTEVIGIDINRRIIDWDRHAYRDNARLQFVHGDAYDWLRAHPQRGTALLSYGGVLEYFAEAQVRDLWRGLGNDLPAAIALAEPMAPEHDPEAHRESFVFGQEESFSHDHRRLLEQCGYTLDLTEDTTLGRIRWQLLVAHRDA